MTVDVSIILPTYNERENIPHLLTSIENVFKKNNIEGQIVVVDDDSPDGTGMIVNKLSIEYQNIRMLKRSGKMGLSSAVMEGFKISEGEILGVMDADFSHPPEKIVEFLEAINNGCDLVLGSRYIKGGGYSDWNFQRKVISTGATLLARPFTDVSDPMSGFFFIKKQVIEDVELNPIGFKIGLEILVKGDYSNYIEIPYIFNQRKKGDSKLGKKVVVEYIYQLICLLAYKMKNIVR